MAALRHALQRDDRQVVAALVEVDHELQSGARLAPDFCRRRGARRVAWPVWSWLESRPSAGGRNTPVAFIGRPAAQSCVRAAAMAKWAREMTWRTADLTFLGHPEGSGISGRDCLGNGRPP